MSRFRQTLRRLAPAPVRQAVQRVRRFRRGQTSGWQRPPWWPDRLHWPGPRNPHAGQSVTIFAGAERCQFLPAVHGRLAGHVFAGTHRPSQEDLAAALRRLSLPAEAARALALISGFEGGFDAIQTYDRGKFSWGFIQFTITGGLPRLLQTIHDEAPEVFASVFRAGGIDVAHGQVVLRVAGRTLRGRAMQDRLHDDPAFWTPFIRAARLTAVQDLQVKVAFDAYYRQPLAIPVTLGGRTMTLGDLLAGNEYGRAVVCDRAVNRGVGHARVLFQAAVDHCRAEGPDDVMAILACVRAMEATDGWRLDALATALPGAPGTPGTTAP